MGKRQRNERGKETGRGRRRERETKYGERGMKKRAHGATCRSCRAAGDSLRKHGARLPQRRLPSFVPRRTLASLSLKHYPKREREREREREKGGETANRLARELFSLGHFVSRRTCPRAIVSPPALIRVLIAFIRPSGCPYPTRVRHYGRMLVWYARKRSLTLSESPQLREKNFSYAGKAQLQA